MAVIIAPEQVAAIDMGVPEDVSTVGSMLIRKAPEHFMDTSEYGYLPAALAFIDYQCPVEDEQVKINFTQQGIERGLVKRPEITKSGLPYIARSVITPPEGYYDQYLMAPVKTHNILEIGEIALDFGLQPGFYGVTHSKPKPGHEIDPNRSHRLGIAYIELFVPMGKAAIKLGLAEPVRPEDL